MTVAELKYYIRKDLRRLRKERKVATPANKFSCKNETLRNYLATRENTLREILGLLS